MIAVTWKLDVFFSDISCVDILHVCCNRIFLDNCNVIFPNRIFFFLHLQGMARRIPRAPVDVSLTKIFETHATNQL